MCEEEYSEFTPVEEVDLQELVDGPDFGGMGWPCGRSVWDWVMNAGDDKSEVWRLENATSGCGSLALGSQIYQDVEFDGSFTNLGGDDDWIGIVFGYQDIGHFYIVSAPFVGETHTTPTPWRLTKVSSETGNTSDEMMKAIMTDEDVEGQTTILLKPTDQGWQRDKINSWRVVHRPSVNYLAISVEVDSAPQWSHEWEYTFSGHQQTGRVGLFTFSQQAKFLQLSVKELCQM